MINKLQAKLRPTSELQGEVGPLAIADIREGQNLCFCLEPVTSIVTTTKWASAVWVLSSTTATPSILEQTTGLEISE